MPHTNAWNEATPAGSDVISNGDNVVRAFKLDVRERMALDHVWNVDTTHDGKHLRVRLRSAVDVTSIETDSANTLSGVTSGGLLNLAQTWNNAGGTFDAMKVNITDSASNAASLLLNLQKGGTSQFKVDKNGGVTCLGGVTAGSGAVAVIGSTGKIPGISSVYFTSLDGSTLTGLSASALASGTVPDARFPATLPALSGVNLTNLNAANLGSGIVPAARIESTYYNLYLQSESRLGLNDSLSATGAVLLQTPSTASTVTHQGWAGLRNFSGTRIWVPYWQ